MKIYPGCFPCFFQQAIRAARLAGSDEKKIWQILKKVNNHLAGISLEKTPPEIGRVVYSVVSEVTGIQDPFVEIKARCIEEALSMYPRFRDWIDDSSDVLEAAVKLSVAGNVIDFGTGQDFELERDVQKIMAQDFTVFHIEEFKDRLKRADSILFLADNAGETVFDRLLIEEMKKPVLYAVRAKPVINDAVTEDAVKSGLEEVATIISSGSDLPGTLLSACSEEFVKIFRSSDLIISKGQGNFECLSDEKSPIFFLLKVKCPVIAEYIRVEQGSILLMKTDSYD